VTELLRRCGVRLTLITSSAAYRRWRGIAVIAVVTVLAVGLAGYGAVRYSTHRYAGRVVRIDDPFAAIPPSTRPSRTTKGLTLLLIGLDTESHRTRDGRVTATEPMARSDVLMVIRINAARTAATVASIPRDSWVDIPGHGKAKINASYAWGKSSLTVRAVEKLTDLRIDHVVIIDWTGFRALTDAVGGVDVTIPADTYDRSQGVRFTKGVHHLNGEQALLYVRQRYGLPRGDFDRVQRQQNFISLLLTQLTARETVTEPANLLRLIRAVTSTVRVDEGFSNDEMIDLATNAAKLRGNIRFLTAPVAGTGREGDESVVYLNSRLNQPFWEAIRQDRVDAYVAKHGAETLTTTPR
jgi:LCP family protein required for cell wall assembly